MTLSQDTTAPAPSGRQTSSTFARSAEALALPVLTVVLIVFFVLLPATSQTFASEGNLRVMLVSNSVLVIIAMASLLPIISGNYDFSVGAVCGLASMVVAQALVSGLPLVVAVLIGAAVGVLIGAFNGFLVTVIGVDSVIVTLGMPMLIAGVMSWQWAGKAIVSGIPPELAAISKPLFLGIPAAALIAVLVALVVWYVVRQTPFGRYLQAAGSNRSAAALVGIRPNRITFITFLMSGGLAGLAGAVQVGVAGAANPNVGPNFTLPAIAAVFLSVAAISPGRFNVWGTCVAIVFLAVLNSGLTLAGASGYVNNLANGAALIVGVATAALLRRRSGR